MSFVFCSKKLKNTNTLNLSSEHSQHSRWWFPKLKCANTPYFQSKNRNVFRRQKALSIVGRLFGMCLNISTLSHVLGKQVCFFSFQSLKEQVEWSLLSPWKVTSPRFKKPLHRTRRHNKKTKTQVMWPIKAWMKFLVETLNILESLSMSNSDHLRAEHVAVGVNEFSAKESVRKHFVEEQMLWVTSHQFYTSSSAICRRIWSIIDHLVKVYFQLSVGSLYMDVIPVMKESFSGCMKHQAELRPELLFLTHHKRTSRVFILLCLWNTFKRAERRDETDLLLFSCHVLPVYLLAFDLRHWSPGFLIL